MANPHSSQWQRVSNVSGAGLPTVICRHTNDMRMWEQSLYRHKLGPVAGVDEAGRGACFGPMMVAACVLPPRQIRELQVLNDSKQLRPAVRDELFDVIRRQALAYSIVSIPATEIDRWGVGAMNLAGMRRAVAQLAIKPGYVLTDAMKVPGMTVPHLPVIKGDSMARCIAAASVLAKVACDREIERLALQYPGYGLAGHKGYGTVVHTQALHELGPTPLHRFSYRNVAQAERIFRSSRVGHADAGVKVL